MYAPLERPRALRKCPSRASHSAPEKGDGGRDGAGEGLSLARVGLQTRCTGALWACSSGFTVWLQMPTPSVLQ